jgi:filamentous hemagglutinin
VTSPVLSAVQTVQQMADAAGKTKDGRMQALAAANMGFGQERL